MEIYLPGVATTLASFSAPFAEVGVVFKPSPFFLFDDLKESHFFNFDTKPAIQSLP